MYFLKMSTHIVIYRSNTPRGVLPVFDPEDLCVEVVDVLVALGVGDGVDQHEAVPLTHVLLPHGTELLLPRCVQH